MICACGCREFEPKRSDQSYFSRACRQHKPTRKTCEHCSCEFTTTRRKDQRHCTDACKNRAACKRYRERQPKPCLRCAARGCKRTFVRTPRTAQVYCRPKCRIRATRQTQRAMVRARRKAA